MTDSRDITMSAAGTVGQDDHSPSDVTDGSHATPVQP